MIMPSSMNKLPFKIQNLYNSSYKKSFAKNKSSGLASRVAWSVVKSRFRKVGGEWVAKGLGLTFYSFEMKTTEDVFIKKGSDNEYYLEATLSDDNFDSQGKRFTASALKDYANQITKYGIAGFITHSDWDEFKLANSHLSEQEFINKARTERKGILKTVRAIYENGKLWIKALVDKRYLKQVRKFNKVSIEALVPSRFQVGNEYNGGYPLGFALDNNAINPRAIIVR